MKYRLNIFFVFLAMITTGCNRSNRNTYAIRDFRPSLQPSLIEVVSKGIVGFDTATRFIQSHASDKELRQLARSEHPVLRAVAFRTMLDRPSFNHFDVIMNNLDDTATVATDAGEWGIRYSTISDDILYHGT